MMDSCERPNGDDQEDISLARLTEAFAEVLGRADPAVVEIFRFAQNDNAAQKDNAAQNDNAAQSDSAKNRSAADDGPPRGEPPPPPLEILEAMLHSAACGQRDAWRRG
jgi:hypothetical protein